MKVFVGGSRRLARLNKKVTRFLDSLIEMDRIILIGDANGADKAVQRYLVEKGYRNVIVFCMHNQCRNNIGDWETKRIEPGVRDKGSAFYAVKDLAMVKEADRGLMLWDSKSEGTRSNILNLLTQRKPVTVYLSPTRTLCQLTGVDDLAPLIRKCDDKLVHQRGEDHASSASVSQSALWPAEACSGSETAHAHVVEPGSQRQ